MLCPFPERVDFSLKAGKQRNVDQAKSVYTRTFFIVLAVVITNEMKSKVLYRSTRLSLWYIVVCLICFVARSFIACSKFSVVGDE